MLKNFTIGMPHIEILLDTLQIGVPVRIENARRGIVVIRGRTSVSAFEDSCPHAQWQLSSGEVCEGVLECPGHGWEFDTDSGRCLNVPSYALRRFEVRILAGVVRIECPGSLQTAEESVRSTTAASDC